MFLMYCRSILYVHLNNEMQQAIITAIREPDLICLRSPQTNFKVEPLLTFERSQLEFTKYNLD